MKHNWKETGQLLAWTAASVSLGMWLTGKVSSTLPTAGANPWLIAAMALVAILAGAFMWWKIFKYKEDAVIYIMPVIVATLLLRFFNVVNSPMWVNISVAIVSAFIYGLIADGMRHSWRATRQLMWFSNLVFAICLAQAAAVLANYLPPIVALALLGLVAVYDVIAVWKTGHMQEMAKKFLDLRILPGFGVPKEKENEWALLGGGDVFFIVVTAGSFLKTSPAYALMVGGGMFLSLVILFLMSEKGKFYPAIPYLFAGAMAGLGAARVFL